MERIVPKNLEQVKELYENDVICMIDLKPLPVEDKAEIIKYAMSKEDLDDPLMIMNLYNFVKVYNTLEDSYFEAPDIYVNSVEELLDLKLAISKELKEFTRQISIYFMSLFKSYNKMVYTSADEHKPLPPLYNTIFTVSDFLTLSGIFAKTPEISTKDLVYIDNAQTVLAMLITKGANTLNGLCELFADKEVENDTSN